MSSPTPEKSSRRTQLVRSYQMTKKTDPRIGLWILGAFLLGAGLAFLVFYFLPGDGWISWILTVVSSLLTGLLVATIVFGRRAQRSMYTQMEGQPGSAAGALGMLRRGWRVDPVIGFTKQQDVVHRVVGPPGIVLVGEGSSHARVRQLLTSERRKHERVASESPIHEVICGRGEDEVPLPKLVKHVSKLGRQVKPAEITDILNRLKALDAHRPNVPLPKGPMPTNMKGMRGHMRGR